MLDSHGKALKPVVEKKDDGKIRDYYGKEIKAPDKTEHKEVKMIQGKEEKKVGDTEGEKFVKH